VNYEAVLFDIDGTLVDSNDAHAHAWVEALAAGGRHVDFARVRPLIGMGSDKLLPRLGVDPESQEGKAVIRRRREIFNRVYLPNLQPTRGAHELVESLFNEGLTLVVATSAERSEVGDLLEVAHVSEFFKARTSSSDAEQSKPDPDIIHAALGECECDARNAIMVGDTPYDVEAASRAGVRIVALRSGGWSDEDLQGAAAVYDDPRDLLDHLDALPFDRRMPARSS
jgi:HAD superfamily hydrolase (TIGR01509 family)